MENGMNVLKRKLGKGWLYKKVSKEKHDYTRQFECNIQRMLETSVQYTFAVFWFLNSRLLTLV